MDRKVATVGVGLIRVQNKQEAGLSQKLAKTSVPSGCGFIVWRKSRYTVYHIPCLEQRTDSCMSEMGWFGARRTGESRAVRWQHLAEEKRCWADAPERVGLSEQCNVVDDPGAGYRWCVPPDRDGHHGTPPIVEKETERVQAGPGSHPQGKGVRSERVPNVEEQWLQRSRGLEVFLLAADGCDVRESLMKQIRWLTRTGRPFFNVQRGSAQPHLDTQVRLNRIV